MKFRRITALVMAGAMALAACGDDIGNVADELEDSTDVSISDEVEQNAVALAAEVESEMTAFATEVQSSDAAAELESAWNDLQATLTASIASMGTDGSVDTEAISEELDEFQTTLDSAGGSVSDELQELWTSLRSKIEQMMG